MKALILITFIFISSITYSQGKIISSDNTIEIDSFYVKPVSSGPHFISQVILYVPVDCFIEYNIYDTTENLIGIIFDAYLSRGKHIIDYKDLGDSIASGLYTYSFKAITKRKNILYEKVNQVIFVK